MNKKRVFSLLLCMIMVFTGYAGVFATGYSQTDANSIYSKADVKNLSAKSFSLLDFDSGTIVYEGNGTQKFPVGNMVKLMTLYLAFEAISNGQTSLDAEFLVVQSAQDKSVGRERVFLDAGKKERITVEQAIEAICIASANDAAYALAHYIGKSEEGFVEKMNKKALELGLKNTFFTDSAGLEAGHYMSANDAAILSYHLIKNYPEVLNYTIKTYGEFDHWSTGQEKTMMVSSNHLIKFYNGSDGLITGYSKEDGYAGIGTISVDDKRVIAVVIGVETQSHRAAELKKLLEYGLAEFEYRVIDEAGTFVRRVPIKDGVKKQIATATASDFAIVLQKSEFDKITREVTVSRNLKAPIKRGEVVGEVIYKLNDEEIGRVDIVADEDMGRVGWFKRLIRKILAWLGLD